MLGEVVCKVVVSSLSEDDELALLGVILNQVEVHVDCFGAAMLDSMVGNSSSGSVVRGDRGGWLWVSHFVEESTEAVDVLGVEEEPSDFGFGCRGHDVIDDGGDGVDGAVVGWWRLVYYWVGTCYCGFA